VINRAKPAGGPDLPEGARGADRGSGVPPDSPLRSRPELPALRPGTRHGPESQYNAGCAGRLSTISQAAKSRDQEDLRLQITCSTLRPKSTAGGRQISIAPMVMQLIPRRE